MDVKSDNETYLADSPCEHSFPQIVCHTRQIRPCEDGNDDGHERQCDDPETVEDVSVSTCSSAVEQLHCLRCAKREEYIHEISVSMLNTPHRIEVHSLIIHGPVSDKVAKESTDEGQES